MDVYQKKRQGDEEELKRPKAERRQETRVDRQRTKADLRDRVDGYECEYCDALTPRHKCLRDTNG